MNNNAINSSELPRVLLENGYLLNTREFDFGGLIPFENLYSKFDIILNKVFRKNILLVGHPGTGKTSAVLHYYVSRHFDNLYIIECNKLISNTAYRGQFEQKITDILEYVNKFNLCVFFDEMHALIGLGKVDGGMCITDILKPYLITGSVVFIGATTLKESKIFMQDEAFKRRFSLINMPICTDDFLLSIANKVMKHLKILEDKILNTADLLYIIAMLSKNLTHLFFPDKLVDFLDYYYASLKIQTTDIKLIIEEYIHDTAF